MKTCSKCKQEKEMSDFYKDSQKSDGRSSSCKSCSYIHRLSTKNERNRKRNEYRKDNLEYRKQRKEYRNKNRERLLKQRREIRMKNREKICEKEKEQRKNPLYKLTKNLRTRMYHAIIANCGFKKGTSQELLGAEFYEVKSHIESLFTEGMDWSNYGKWHIDHIKPCNAFDLTLKEDQKKCFHYTNLQPLWAFDNISKSDTWKENSGC